MIKHVLVLAAAGLLTTACGGSGGNEAIAIDNPKHQEWCESFKRMENSTHGVELDQVGDDTRDPSLSQAERNAASKRWNELIAMPVNGGTDAACEGPVWDRFLQETEIRSSSLAAAPPSTTTTSPEQALYSKYAEALTAAGIPFRPGTGTGTGSFSSDQSICEGLRAGRSDAYSLATIEGVRGQNENGRRIVTMVPILCPEQQVIVDQALTGDVRRTTFTSGKYLVGSGLDQPVRAAHYVSPGTYQTETSVSDCYWERSDSQGNIIDNNMVSIAPSITVTIAPTDGGFTAKGCGTWKLVE